MSKTILRTRELAVRTGMSESFWYKKRLRGDGPPYIMLGDTPVYDWDVVCEWMDTQTQLSTSDTGQCPPRVAPTLLSAELTFPARTARRGTKR